MMLYVMVEAFVSMLGSWLESTELNVGGVRAKMVTWEVYHVSNDICQIILLTCLYCDTAVTSHIHLNKQKYLKYMT